jgi:thymidylate synthase (FAD)
MTDITFRSDMTVQLISQMGDDKSIAMSARVSSGSTGDAKKDMGLINMLMRDRHGSPFESVLYTFRIECPIFVAREFFRHRIASYNETSGRYRVLEPVFYAPDPERPLRQIGKPGAYTFEAGDYRQGVMVRGEHERIATEAWKSYDSMLEQGIAREVARNILPLSLYTSFYVTMNLRSLLNFLSLRWAHEDAKTPTFPLYEIEQVAKQMDARARMFCPVTFKHFDKHGRVAP